MTFNFFFCVCVFVCWEYMHTFCVLFMFLYEEWLAYWACYPIFVVSFPMIVTLYFTRPPIVLLAAERRGSVYFTSSKRTENMKESLKISNSSLSRLHCAITFIEHYLKLQFKGFFSLNLLFTLQRALSVPWFSNHISRLMYVNNNMLLK